MTSGTPARAEGLSPRERYQQRMREIESAFHEAPDGLRLLAERTALVDELVGGLWGEVVLDLPEINNTVTLLAIGGYGRKELFPCSDVDLFFLLDSVKPSKVLSAAIKRMSQEMWDCGVRVSPQTRSLAECDRFDPENLEFVIALLDQRYLAGSEALYAQLHTKVLPKMLVRESPNLLAGLQEITAARHAKYGNTLFHLEPNIKECPGGLRDVHVCSWLSGILRTAMHAGKLHEAQEALTAVTIEETEFKEAVTFLTTVRCFLHYRHKRDDNTLDWQAQDAAAKQHIGMPQATRVVDAAYWMRLYFRYARTIERRTLQFLDELPAKKSKLSGISRTFRSAAKPPAGEGFHAERGRLILDPPNKDGDPADDPNTILKVFEMMAAQGWRLGPASELRVADALPLLSAHLDDGPAVWNHLQKILTSPFAGRSLRAMHALGILELLIPEFHGIDALAVRDAYHRYTVDEHTFLLIDTLHGLSVPSDGPLGVWKPKFEAILNDVEHPEALYLAALMHDTGKGRSHGDHAVESSRMAQDVCGRMDLDTHETELVLNLIRNHLEMSAALRRDIFDNETIRSFAGKVATPEQLRMLVVFTYADISAVHPDALTPWKAENLWRLYMATANFLDRSVDEERVDTMRQKDLIKRVSALVPKREDEVNRFLDGMPQRYLLTHTPEEIRAHFLLAIAAEEEDPIQLAFEQGNELSQLALVAQDRPLLFATMTGALSALGMNIVTADAFSNAHGIVVDSFGFTDTFRTLELNPSERAPFLNRLREVMHGTLPLEKLLASRKRSRWKKPLVTVETQAEFDDQASTHSTLLQVVAQDVHGLLHALSLAIANFGCNIEVALIDTEGETAIDVFYLTRNGDKLKPSEQTKLRQILLEAIADNAS